MALGAEAKQRIQAMLAGMPMPAIPGLPVPIPLSVGDALSLVQEVLSKEGPVEGPTMPGMPQGYGLGQYWANREGITGDELKTFIEAVFRDPRFAAVSMAFADALCIKVTEHMQAVQQQQKDTAIPVK